MGTHPTFSPSTGPSAAYQPKTTDEGDGTVAGGVVPHVNAQVQPYGVAGYAPVPGASANGTSLAASPPATKRGARIVIKPGASITYGIAGSQPGSAPTTVTWSNPSTNTSDTNVDEDLAGTMMVFVTAVTGTVVFRWI